ncbi:MAG TPA: protein-disulfide reductase DsbD [Gammaproteobacteria bacterium]
MSTLRHWLPAALLLAASHLGAAPLPGFGDSELLRPEQAYRMQAEARGDGLVVRWQIADGYYLYRDKLGFSSATPGITLGAAALPAPTEIKQDAFFGEMAVYRGEVAIPVAVERPPGPATVLALEVNAQGCADIGVCYPPETRRTELQLAALEAPAAPPATPLLQLLGQKLGFGNDEPEFLDPEVAFVFSADPTPDGRALVARWQIADGYYLYRDKFAFSVADGAPVRLGEAALPDGKVKQDPYFGRMEIYTHEVAATVPVARIAQADGPVTVTASYQGCADEGICYPPMQQQFVLDLGLISSAAAAPAPAQFAAQPAAPGVSLSEQDSIAAALAGGSTLLTVASFFGFGLLLAFTPCVFPMIPILSGIIVGHGRQVTTRKAFALSAVYVLAMAVTYTAAGVVAGLFGSNLQAAFQNPWILGAFSAVFVALALSMFGFYDLQMPSWLQTKLSEVSHRQKGGSLAGAGVMGVLSALIVGPCVAAPLAGALIYIGQTGDALLGGTALFALSLGMGAPLLAIGTSAGRLLPRAGAWMEAVKKVFGVLLLGVAIWMLERIVPGPVALLLWAALLVVSAIYLGALQALPAGSSGWRKTWKGLGLVLLVYGALLVLGATRGNDDVLRPLAGFHVAGLGGGEAHAELPFKRIKSVADLEREVAQAVQQGRSVMLDYYADWCVTCKEMERETFVDPGVHRALVNTTTLQADVTANDAEDQALLRHFGLIGPPTILFFGSDGVERRSHRVMGFMDADAFRRQIESALR